VRVDASNDEVLYVLGGTATATIDGDDRSIAPGVGVFISRGTHWSLEAAGGLELVSVLVRDPEPLPQGAHAVVDLGSGERGRATAARQFTLGVTAMVGCASATQFVGYVPPGRAPDHFHRYDEVLYVLAGRGVLHAGGEQAPFSRGSCIHLPARLVHTLENTGEEELQLLGVFRPAGSPAEAYYPDGTPAADPGPAR
jgi:mannose-6-phosphate isomerase-like protein (cupin superfamily)